MRFAHYDLARHDQNFLARHCEILARLDRSERRAQTAGPDDCYQYHVRICQAGDLEQTRFAGKNPRLVIECSPKNVNLALINQANRFRPDFIRSGGQLLCVAFRREPYDFHPLRNVPRNFQRALTDGASCAKNNDTLMIHRKIFATGTPGSARASRALFGAPAKKSWRRRKVNSFPSVAGEGAGDSTRGRMRSPERSAQKSG